jgi:hypothetical protein
VDARRLEGFEVIINLAKGNRTGVRPSILRFSDGRETEPEIWRILTEGGTWINNGKVVPR